MRNLLEEQLRTAATTSSSKLGLGLIVGIAAAVLAASKGARALVQAVNVAYDEDETRGFVKLRVLGLTITLVGLIFIVAALLALTVLPAVGDRMGDGGRLAASIIRWPLLALLGVVALAALYRYAPDRDDARWEWVTPGALTAVVIWLLGSVAFTIYADQFGSFGKTYGALGAVVVLMLWLFITAMAVLTGAEINGETERQTMKDTTIGAAAPARPARRVRRRHRRRRLLASCRHDESPRPSRGPCGDQGGSARCTPEAHGSESDHRDRQMRRRRRDERHQADAATGRGSGSSRSASSRVERGTGQATWRGSRVRPGQLVHQVVADAGDRVRPAVDVELAPDRRHAPGAEVADLVRVATGLAPGPQRRAEAELVLQALVVEEVGVARRRGPAGVGCPTRRTRSARHRTPRHRRGPAGTRRRVIGPPVKPPV